MLGVERVAEPAEHVAHGLQGPARPVLYRGKRLLAPALKETGLNVKVNTMDLGTLFSISNKDEAWHITTSGFGSQPFLGPYMYQQITTVPANLARRKKTPRQPAA